MSKCVCLSGGGGGGGGGGLCGRELGMRELVGIKEKQTIITCISSKVKPIYTHKGLKIDVWLQSESFYFSKISLCLSEVS